MEAIRAADTPDPREAFSGLRIAPSILSADFSRLGSQVEEVMDAGARVIHVDVMDGHFVPPITIGPLIVSAIADQVHGAGGVLDVHLMIERPADQVAEFARAGADCISIHLEADRHVHRTLSAIREEGCLTSLALNPGTSAETVSELEHSADHILCMTVNPGWGGQRFIPGSPEKVRRIRELAPDTVVEVDGGIDAETVGLVAKEGASLFVAGSAIFGRDDPAEAYTAIAAAIDAA
jgi:ribulose-phosphate 3-epimerase